jgi:hypothetical protein
MYEGIHREKSWVRFGISPFGLGRPDRRPPGINGFSQYDKLYADAETWLQNGWLDYFTPQLYWSIRQPGQAYDVLLDYWIGAEHQGPPHLAGPVHQPHRHPRPPRNFRRRKSSTRSASRVRAPAPPATSTSAWLR